VTGKDIAVIEGERREGDPAVLVADSALAIEMLHWKAKYADLTSIVRHAWQWESR
jgi:UDP-glucose 4-epimerase